MTVRTGSGDRRRTIGDRRQIDGFGVLATGRYLTTTSCHGNKCVGVGVSVLVRLPRSDSLAGYLLGCEKRQLHPVWCLCAGVAVAPRCQDWRGGLRGVGRDEPPGHVFAVCDLDCQADRSGYPAAGLDRVDRLGLGIVDQFEGRPACVEKDDSPGPGMGGRALMSRHAADQAGPFGVAGRGPVLASTMGTPGATAAATAAKRSRSSRQPVIL